MHFSEYFGRRRTNAETLRELFVHRNAALSSRREDCCETRRRLAYGLGCFETSGWNGSVRHYSHSGAKRASRRFPLALHASKTPEGSATSSCEPRGTRRRSCGVDPTDPDPTGLDFVPIRPEETSFTIQMFGDPENPRRKTSLQSRKR